MTEMAVRDLLDAYRPGSQDWTWDDEFADLDATHGPRLAELRAAISAAGVARPILLGSDGRVWDGHRRIRVAVQLGLPSVPVTTLWDGAPT